jgi:hypothetical protein
LIEHAGIKRGYIHGNVGTSTKHALAIINRGGGTAVEVVELMELIQRRVLEEFGVVLAPEPVFVGFDSEKRISTRGVGTARRNVEGSLLGCGLVELSRRSERSLLLLWS